MSESARQRKAKSVHNMANDHSYVVVYAVNVLSKTTLRARGSMQLTQKRLDE